MPLESRDVALAPSHVAMTNTHIILASERTVYIWQYRTQVCMRSWGTHTDTVHVTRIQAAL